MFGFKLVAFWRSFTKTEYCLMKRLMMNDNIMPAEAERHS